MNALYLGSLDTGKTKRLGSIDSIVRFVTTRNPQQGKIFYYRDGALVARAFNLSTEELEGEPTVALDHVGYNPTGLGIEMNVSVDGHVAVWGDGSEDLPHLTWYSRTGQSEGELGIPSERTGIRISPDSTRLVYAGVDPQSGNRDVFVMDLARGIATRLTNNIANDWFPAWSPESRNLAFVSDRPQGGVFVKPATEVSAPETEFYRGPFSPEDWSRDGHWIGGLLASSNGGLWVAEAKAGAPPIPIVPSSGGRPDGLRFSPDTRWIAYVSAESGQPEVYVRKFSGTSTVSEAIRLTREGGDFPVWNPKGGELFFVSRDLTLWSVNTTGLGNGPGPEPERLFRFCGTGSFANAPLTSASYVQPYDTRDGKRFLASCITQPAHRFNVLVNPAFAR